MKRLLLTLACALIWAAATPSPASAHWWNFHSKKHADASAAPKQKQSKTKKSWFHHEHHARNSSDPLYTSGPKSVGWWRKMPGPAGAGS